MKKIFFKKILLCILLWEFNAFLKINAMSNISDSIQFKFNQNLTAQITSLAYTNNSNEKTIIKIPSKISKDGIYYTVTSFSDNFDINCFLLSTH